MNPQIAGYDFGVDASARSPLSTADLGRIERTLGWSDEDEAVLRKHQELFRRQAERMVDSWRAVIGAQPHLSQWFLGPDGKPDDEYKARVKRRFIQWVIDVATRRHDEAWLDYQEEIGLRHTPAKKNVTEGRQTAPLVPLRYLLAFVPVAANIREFLQLEIPDSAELARVETAWAKAVHLHVTLWSRPYTRDGLW